MIKKILKIATFALLPLLGIQHAAQAQTPIRPVTIDPVTVNRSVGEIAASEKALAAKKQKAIDDARKLEAKKLKAQKKMEKQQKDALKKIEKQQKQLEKAAKEKEKAVKKYDKAVKKVDSFEKKMEKQAKAIQKAERDLAKKISRNKITEIDRAKSEVKIQKLLIKHKELERDYQDARNDLRKLR